MAKLVFWFVIWPLMLVAMIIRLVLFLPFAALVLLAVAVTHPRMVLKAPNMFRHMHGMHRMHHMHRRGHFGHHRYGHGGHGHRDHMEDAPEPVRI